MDVVAESRRNPSVSKHQTRFSLSVENELADAGRDGRIRLASRSRILNLRRKREQRKHHLPSVQLTTSRIGNLTRLIYTLVYVMTTHPCYTH